jgi:hypothetical protein
MLRKAAKFLAGTVAGALLWWYATPGYNSVVAEVAVRLLRFDSRLHDLVQTPKERWTFLESASGTFGTATVPTDQLTYNLILFIAIVAATEEALFRGRKLRAIAIAALLLFVTHVLTFVVTSEAIYATSEASGAAWGELETQFWYYAVMFLRLVGMLAFAFGCWIFVRTHGNEVTARRRAKAR